MVRKGEDDKKKGKLLHQASDDEMVRDDWKERIEIYSLIRY
jgi:hypothetical protein